MYQFKKVSPSPFLQPYINGYWLLERQANCAITDPVRLIPDGYPELVFALEKRFAMQQNDGFHRHPEVGFIGQLSKTLEVKADLGAKALYVKMYPWTPSLLMNVPQNLLINSVADLKNLIPTLEIQELHYRLQDAENLTSTIQHLETYLIKKIQSNPQFNPILHLSVSKIFFEKGQTEMDTLTQSIKISSRYLEKLFKEQIGISPNRYARLIKIKKASMLLAEERPDNLTSFALENGFYDAAHFSRDFRKLAGFSPTEFIKYAESFPIIEKSSYLNQWDY